MLALTRGKELAEFPHPWAPPSWYKILRKPKGTCPQIVPLWQQVILKQHHNGGSPTENNINIWLKIVTVWLCWGNVGYDNVFGTKTTFSKQKCVWNQFHSDLIWPLIICYSVYFIGIVLQCFIRMLLWMFLCQFSVWAYKSKYEPLYYFETSLSSTK